MFVQGDVVCFDFPIPGTNKVLEHPAVIISTKEVYEADKVYICAMMTTSERTDVFSFPLRDNMVESPFSKPGSQVRCHLITYAKEANIKTKQGMRYNRLRPMTLERLLAKICEVTFGYTLPD